jgi:hypothetical protein
MEGLVESKVLVCTEYETRVMFRLWTTAGGPAERLDQR